MLRCHFHSYQQTEQLGFLVVFIFPWEICAAGREDPSWTYAFSCREGTSQPCSPGDAGQEGGSAWSSLGQPSVGCPVLPSSSSAGSVPSQHPVGWQRLRNRGALQELGAWHVPEAQEGDCHRLCTSIYCLSSFPVSKRKCSLSGNSCTRDVLVFSTEMIGTGHKHSLFLSNSPVALLKPFCLFIPKCSVTISLAGLQQGDWRNLSFWTKPKSWIIWIIVLKWLLLRVCLFWFGFCYLRINEKLSPYHLLNLLVGTASLLLV